jgi:hypothetical protein
MKGAIFNIFRLYSFSRLAGMSSSLWLVLHPFLKGKSDLATDSDGN